MAFDLPRPRPQRTTLEGRYTRLEAIDRERHFHTLLAASTAPGADERFRYLFDEPPTEALLEEFERLLE